MVSKNSELSFPLFVVSLSNRSHSSFFDRFRVSTNFGVFLCANCANAHKQNSLPVAQTNNLDSAAVEKWFSLSLVSCSPCSFSPFVCSCWFCSRFSIAVGGNEANKILEHLLKKAEEKYLLVFVPSSL
jgi:hypothetical protein